MTWTPPSARPRSFLARAYVERHERMGVSTRIAMLRAFDDAWRFRPNLAAAEGWDAGAEVTLSPWWGTDPLEPQAGGEGTLRVAGGSWSYRVASLVGRAVLPLRERWSLGVEAGGGAAWGDPPPQRLFAVGGAASLRGFDPYALRGPAFARGRLGLSRRFAFGVVSTFTDAAWAGERGDFALSGMLASAGLGVAIADGRLHADAAWGVRGPGSFRVELYLDGAR